MTFRWSVGVHAIETKYERAHPGSDKFFFRGRARFLRPTIITSYVIAGCLVSYSAGGIANSVQAAEKTLTIAVPFNIAAQPLVSALDAYSAATGMQVVYDGELTSGHRSNAVVGMMAPDLALRRLLKGTGLVVVYGAQRVFTLIPKPIARGSAATIEDYMPYLAFVQSDLEQAFCSTQLTSPGAYRIKISFRIDAAGNVVQPHLLGSTDNSVRDRAITDLLKNLHIDHAPPIDMPQPVVVAISPRPPIETGDCGAEDVVPQRASPP